MRDTGYQANSASDQPDTPASETARAGRAFRLRLAESFYRAHLELLLTTTGSEQILPVDLDALDPP